jgi:hypothetical protein
LKTKRTKISFSTVNEGKYTVISRSDISEVNRRVKDEMKVIVREFERNESISQKDAAKLVLNA